jgi:hypothetical protein
VIEFFLGKYHVIGRDNGHKTPNRNVIFHCEQLCPMDKGTVCAISHVPSVANPGGPAPRYTMAFFEGNAAVIDCAS